jgi:hypothetical protein
MDTESDIIENENPAFRSYCVSVFRPKSTIDKREKHHSDLDDLTRRELSEMKWSAKNATIGHGKTDGYTTSIPAIVSGKILKTALDAEGNVIGLHLNYGNKYGLAASHQIKKGKATDVSSVINVIYDGIRNKYEAVDVGLVKEGRLPGTHVLYTKGHDFEYVRDPKYFSDPIIKQMMTEAQELNKKYQPVADKNIEKQNHKNTHVNTINAIKSVPYYSRNMATPAKEATPTNPPASTPPATDAAKDVPMSDAEQPPTKAAYNPIMEETEYKTALEEHAAIEKAMEENPDAVEEAAKTKLFILERRLGNHDKASMEKRLEESNAKIAQLESVYNSLLSKVQTDNKSSLDKDEELLINLFQSPQGQSAIQSFGYTPEQAAEMRKRLFDHIRSAPVEVQEAASAMFPITVCSASPNTELVNSLQSQLQNSKAKQNAMQKEALIRTLKTESRYQPYSRPPSQQQSRPPTSTPPQHERFNTLPATPAQYNKKQEEASVPNPFSLLDKMRKSQYTDGQDRREAMEKRFPPTPRKNLPTSFPKLNAEKEPAN